MSLSERLSTVLWKITSPVTPAPSTPALTERAVAQPGRSSLRRAERQIAQGSHAEAVASLKLAMAQGADRFGCLLRIAQVQGAARRWKEALSMARQVACLFPKRLEAWECVVVAARGGNDLTAALSACESMIKLAPRCLPAFEAMTEIYMQLGRMDAALRAVNVLIRLDPMSGAHHVCKGLLYQHQDEIALAVHEFTLAVTMEPEGPQTETALEALGILDAHQLNQIMLLAMEDAVFRANLCRDAIAATVERGFALSPIGQQMISEMSAQALAGLPQPARLLRYN